MMNDNHKKSNCGFAEELVSYLYGETNEAESAKFEAHLANCVACADELEAFSGVHFSLDDWKTKEFAALETPVIEIPYPPARQQEISGVKESWWSGLSGLFSALSPVWSLSAASVAILAVIVGIVLFSMNSRTRVDFAESNKMVNPVAVATIEKTPEPPKPINSPDKVVKPVNEPKSPPSELAVEPNPKNNRVVKATNNPRAKTENSTKNPDAKRDNKNKNVPPAVIPDEDEDDTLRLAELFEEIGAKE